MEQMCCKCKDVFSYEEKDIFWDYRGLDYDAKLVKCPQCGAVSVIKYYELPNREEWYYK
jgi:hypothetical protein